MLLCPPGHRPLQKNFSQTTRLHVLDCRQLNKVDIIYFSQTTRLHVLDCRQLNKVGIRVSSKQTRKLFVWNRNNGNKICFSLFRETKNNKFRFVLVFQTYIKTTEINRTVSKQTKTTQNYLKNTKIWSLSNCFGWSSFCFVSIETSILSVSVSKQTTETNYFDYFETNQNKPKQTRKTLNFQKKIPKYAFHQTISVGLLFVSVQS